MYFFLNANPLKCYKNEFTFNNHVCDLLIKRSQGHPSHYCGIRVVNIFIFFFKHQKITMIVLRWRVLLTMHVPCCNFYRSDSNSVVLVPPPLPRLLFVTNRVNYTRMFLILGAVTPRGSATNYLGLPTFNLNLSSCIENYVLRSREKIEPPQLGGVSSGV